MTASQSKYAGWIIHLTVWAVILGMPLFVTNPDRPLITGRQYAHFLLVPISFMIVFYTNYFLLIGRELSSRHISRYLVYNLLLVGVVMLGVHLCFRYVLPPNNAHPPMVRPWQDTVRFFGGNAILYLLVVGVSVAIRMTGGWYRAETARQELEHRRTEAERSNFEYVYPETPPVKSLGGTSGETSGTPSVLPAFDPALLNRFRHSYNSFAPRVVITWRPGQYYYMDGSRKVNLHSRYPVVSLDWERGIAGVLPNSGSYERFEVDYQHHVPLGPMRDLYYRLGWGKFTDQKDIYFEDFANLARRNLPVGWSDEIGGVFQLLDGRWYNASREYVRAHLTYEAPFLLLPHLMKYTQYVLNERVYLNALVVPHLKPYLEAGYGIGTHVFDFGVFVSFANWDYQEVGCKFTFELFNR